MGCPFYLPFPIDVRYQGSSNWNPTLTGALLRLFNRYLETVRVVEHGELEMVAVSVINTDASLSPHVNRVEELQYNIVLNFATTKFELNSNGYYQ